MNTPKRRALIDSLVSRVVSAEFRKTVADSYRLQGNKEAESVWLARYDAKRFHSGRLGKGGAK